MHPFPRAAISTARLVLRPLNPGDVPALFALHADAQTMRYWSGPAWVDDSRGHRMVAADADAAPQDHLRLGITLSATGQLVGTCSLFQILPQCRRAELGYLLGASAWGQGLMHEALSAFLDHAFTQMNLHRIEADTDPRNARSMQLLRRLGFQQEGLFRQRWIVDGEVSDSAMFGLLQPDWRMQP